LDYPPIQLEELPPLQPRLPVLFSDESRLKTIPYESETQSLPGIQASGELAGEARVVEGYRVQVYAGKDQAAARKIELQIRERYGVAIYLVYEAPQYKVRVGDFIDRNQAVNFGKSLKEGGYMDAWIVRSLVPVGR